MNAKHFILGGALALAAPAFAHDKDQHVGAMQGEKLPHADQEMIKKLHLANREEIELGQVAQQQSTRDDVKQLGKMMVDDHRAADEKIAKMATDHGVAVGDESEAMKLADKLRKKTGYDFDKDYLTKMVKDHDKVISLISSKAKDMQSDFQATLTDMLPTLRKHREEAKRLLDLVKGDKTASARTKAQGRFGGNRR